LPKRHIDDLLCGRQCARVFLPCLELVGSLKHDLDELVSRLIRELAG